MSVNKRIICCIALFITNRCRETLNHHRINRLNRRSRSSTL